MLFTNEQYQLNNIRKGFFLNYQKDVYEVVDECAYKFKKKGIVLEWKLQGFTKTYYLQLIENTEKHWFLLQDIAIRKLDPNLSFYISKNKAPYEEIIYNRITYILEEFEKGFCYPNCKKENETEIYSWLYSNNFDSKILTLDLIYDEPKSRFGVEVFEKDFSHIRPLEI